MVVKKADVAIVVFTWMIWSSKSAHHAGNAKVKAEPMIQPVGGTPMAFDVHWLIMYGFEVMLGA